MKHLIIITVMFVTGMLSAQNNYENDMPKVFELWQGNQSPEAEQLFEQLATPEPSAWLPNY